MSALIDISVGRKTKEIELPSYKGSKLVVYTELPISEQRELQSKFPNMKDDEKERVGYILGTHVKMIKLWNLGKDGKVVEINEETIDQYLFKNDVIMLNSVLAGISYEEAVKKTDEQLEKIIAEKKKDSN